MSKARTLADFISDGSEFADGTISVAEVSGAAPLASPTFTGTASGTFSGPLTGNVTGNLTGAVTGDVTAPEIDLSAISSTIADTAVDVFVYDTSKDSDGGAWRKRTQGTSWYNETLNTATRGARKEFPAVAVIVGTSSGLTIYDGDDPDLPMWMVFNAVASYMIQQGTQNGISMLNGVLGLSSTINFHTVSFIEDISYAFASSGKYLFLNDIAGRNDTSNFGPAQSAYSIVSSTVNDVAMTVLPNAPIDAATGLPVPTIAVATDGGVSVIKDDGTVVDITAGSYTASALVKFTKEQNLLYSFDFDNTRSRYIHIQTIPTADINIGTYGYERGTDDLEFYSSRPESNPDLFLAKYLASVEQFDFAGDYIGGSVYGLAKLGRNQNDPDAGMVAFIDAEHNTGYMVGDIKLATLSDTDDTDVTGSELVTNGDFATDSDWNKGTNWTISGGVANHTSTAGYLEQTLNMSVGQRVTITMTITGNVVILGNGTSIASSNIILPVGTSSVTGTVVSSTLSLYMSGSGTVDNVSVRLAEEDRSVNGNGLQVFGTVTKNPVATGADLVAYSGFTTNSYLRQPYDSAQDFGTGDFSLMMWLNGFDNSSVIYDRLSSSEFGTQGGADATGRLYFYHNNSISFVIGNATVFSTGYALLNQWQHLALVRSSGTITLYVNGEAYYSSTSSGSIGGTTPMTHIGTGVEYNNVPYSGSISLLRLSGTAPSPEQIKKIYEDEKVLFQDGAQATLYGSSDAVTALAYDDSTDLLHVGTSAGRSDFQGLRRVNNTTNAVGAAISASNGMIVEE